MVVERWSGKDGGVARCRAKAGEYGNAERASSWARQGRQGRAATVEDQTSSCWAWLTRCPRPAEAKREREAQVLLELR